MPLQLTAEFSVLTPLYLGGAQKNPRAELRAPSVKGALRFWLRAMAPWVTQCAESDAKGCRLDYESRLFGGAGGQAGQAPFLLRIDPGGPAYGRWSEIDRRKLDPHFERKGDKGLPQNGLGYLAYPFGMHTHQTDNRERTFIEPATGIVMRFAFPRRPTDLQARALLAAVWLLGHCGGLGSRARRGFGALALRNWRWSPAGSGEDGAYIQSLELLKDDLPLAVEEPSGNAWSRGLAETMTMLQSDWLQAPAGLDTASPIPFPWIGPKSRYWLGNSGCPEKEWDQALDDVGRPMQEYRQVAEPDYSDVKEALERGRPPYTTPERASFGLPLNFRFGPRTEGEFLPSLGQNDSSDPQRHASLLMMRPLLLKDRLYPQYLRLDGPVPGESGSTLRNRNNPHIKGFGDSAMDQFLRDKVNAQPLFGRLETRKQHG